jgi:hypothetical protein
MERRLQMKTTQRPLLRGAASLLAIALFALIGASTAGQTIAQASTLPSGYLPFSWGVSVSVGWAPGVGGHVGLYEGHAWDFFAPSGSAVVAAASGTVLAMRNDVPDNSSSICGGGGDPNNPCAAGNWVILSHGSGLYTQYLHLKYGSVVVAPGQTVGIGARLGTIGDTGNASGIHLHFSWIQAPCVSTSQCGVIGTGISIEGTFIGVGEPLAYSGPYASNNPGGLAPRPVSGGIALRSGGTSGYTVDGYGHITPFGGAPTVSSAAYWQGWDIVRGIALRPDGVSGYVLDGWGGIHPFGGAPIISSSAYWQGWDIARGIVLRPDGVSGYVLDGWGGIHPFGGAPVLSATAYWEGWDIARGIALDADGQGGQVLDGWGGLHRFGNAPTVAQTAYWSGWDIARGVALLPFGNGGYVLDGWGGIHRFGVAPTVISSNVPYVSGSDRARGIAVEPCAAGANAWCGAAATVTVRSTGNVETAATFAA